MKPMHPIVGTKLGFDIQKVKSGVGKPQKNFAEILSGELEKNSMVSFSKHAVKRTAQRGLSFEEKDLSKISSAIDKLKVKGSREALVLYKDVGLLVNVNDRRVITCIDKNRLKEDVFTNIDGVMILE